MRKTKTPQAPEGGGPLGREVPRYVYNARDESHALEYCEADGTRIVRAARFAGLKKFFGPGFLGLASLALG